MITITHENNEDLLSRTPDESVDIICIDPPYKYLKNQKLEVDFDEKLFFDNCKRVLTKDGFIIMFGRGVSFYRWNCFLDGLNFTFKEEIVWNKVNCSSPALAISRTHETVSIFSKGNGKINRGKIPYLESKNLNYESILLDIKRLKQILNNPDSLTAVMKYLETGEYLSLKRAEKHTTSAQKGLLRGDNCAAVMKTISEGMNEKSIIKINPNQYNYIHPTQKPVRLLERLLMLCLPLSKKKIVIADYFGGSFSTMEAVVELAKKHPEIEFEGVSCEIDKEYFDLGKNRILKITKDDFNENLDF